MRTATKPWSIEFAGRVDELEIESEVLRDNPLGDPAVRPLWVYLPPGHDDEPDRRMPYPTAKDVLPGSS